MAHVFPLPSGAGPLDSINFKHKTFMIVDDMATARAAIRSIVQQMGGFNINFAVSYNDAIAKLKDRAPPDIVLCDYHLGDGRDGQNLFEEMKHLGIVNDSTIWIMCTAESGYQKVIAVADLAPDDYVLKPFTAENLKDRLVNAAAKKLFFERFHQLKGAGNLEHALVEIKRLTLSGNRRYMVDILRKHVELLIETGRHGEAEQIIDQTPSGKRLPWMKAAKAKCALARGGENEAIALLTDLAKENPNYLSAIDLKADVHSRLGDFLAAQQTLEHLVERNPLNWRRQRRLGRVAHANGDLVAARKANAFFLRHAVMPSVVKDDDRLFAARVHHESGDKHAAMTLIDQVTDQSSFSEHASLLPLLDEFSPERAQRAYASTREQFIQNPEPDLEGSLAFIRAALDRHDLDAATAVAERLLVNDQAAGCFQRVQSVFAAYRQDDAIKGVKMRAAQVLIARRREQAVA